MVILRYASTALALSVFGLSQADGEERGLSRAAVPENGQIVLTDYEIRDWGPEVVRYTLNTNRFSPVRLALLNAEGHAQPFQLEGNTLSFVASVARGTSVTYTLTAADRDRSAEGSSLTVLARENGLEISNALLALRLPPLGKREFAEPVDVSQVPGPLSGWRPGGFTEWLGGSRFTTARRVASFEFRLLRQGPVECEFEARYHFAPKGEYVFRISLADGMPIAIIREDFDLGEIGEGQDVLLLELHRGWTPETILWVGMQAESRGIAPISRKPFSQYIEEKRKADTTSPPVGGMGRAPTPFMPEKELVLLDRTVPAGRWGGFVGGACLVEGEESNPASVRRLGFAPLFVGAWRRAMALDAWYREGTGMILALPIGVRRARWSLDMADDFSPFSTHEHDPALPETYGRRLWGLYVGDRIEEAQARFGYIGLDRYKDWIINLPDPTPQTQSPRPFYPPALVEAVKPLLDQHPDGWLLRQWYLFSGRPEDAIRNAQTVLNGLKSSYGENSFYVSGLTHYRQSESRVNTLLAEDALACPELPTDLRRELRRRLALYANLNSEPDFNPRGAGVHLGNNNMTFNRSFALTYFAALLPDHPRYEEWMEGVTRHFLFKIASQTAVDGPFIECPTYQLYSPARTLNVTLNALRNLGRVGAEAADYHWRTLEYLAHLTMPDPRFENRRIIPGMGNSANRLEEIFGISMAAIAEPKAAGFLRFMHSLSKGYGMRPPDFKGVWIHTHEAIPYIAWYRPDIPAQPRSLGTHFMPTYGVVFRSRFNTPDETAMLLRAGMNWSHWDTDALNVILYGKGAPLSPGTAYQYLPNPAPQQDNGIYHNRVKVGQRDLQEVFGRVDCTIADYSFAPLADYAVAERFYPSQLFADKQGAMRWRRHVAFVKNETPNATDYFVMRDTFPDGENRPKWWNWLNLDGADLIEVEGQPFDAAKAPYNQAVSEAEMPARRGQIVEMKTRYGASTWFWFSRPVEVRLRMTFGYPRQDGLGGAETKTIVEIPAAAGEDFFYVVWPRREGEPVPDCRLVAPDVVRIATPSTTDYIVMADAPVEFAGNGISFSGQAGVVRRTKTAAPTPLLTVAAKPRPSLDLGRGVVVKGEGPFQAELKDDAVVLRTDGRARVLHMTQPPWIIRPRLWIDGQEWMACWTDYPASGWGSYDQTWLIGIAVPAGPREIVVRNMVYPHPWPTRLAPLTHPHN